MKFQLTFSLCVFYHIIFADTCIFSDINVICVCVCDVCWCLLHLGPLINGSSLISLNMSIKYVKFW